LDVLNHQHGRLVENLHEEFPDLEKQFTRKLNVYGAAVVKYWKDVVEQKHYQEASHAVGHVLRILKTPQISDDTKQTLREKASTHLLIDEEINGMLFIFKNEGASAQLYWGNEPLNLHMKKDRPAAMWRQFGEAGAELVKRADPAKGWKVGPLRGQLTRFRKLAAARKDVTG
jgi:hypothetical protein